MCLCEFNNFLKAGIGKGPVLKGSPLLTALRRGRPQVLKRFDAWALLPGGVMGSRSGPWLGLWPSELCCRPDEGAVSLFMAQLLPETQGKVQSNRREKALPTASFRSLGEVSSACLQSSPT